MLLPGEHFPTLQVEEKTRTKRFKAALLVEVVRVSSEGAALLALQHYQQGKCLAGLLVLQVGGKVVCVGVLAEMQRQVGDRATS